MPLACQYEEENIIIYFTVSSVELLVTELRQKRVQKRIYFFISVWVLFFALMYPQNVWEKWLYLLKSSKRQAFYFSGLVLQNVALTSVWHSFHHCVHQLSKFVIIWVSHFS